MLYHAAVSSPPPPPQLKLNTRKVYVGLMSLLYRIVYDVRINQGSPKNLMWSQATPKSPPPCIPF